MTAPFDYLSFRRQFLPGEDEERPFESAARVFGGFGYKQRPPAAPTSNAQAVSNMSTDYLAKRKAYLDATIEDYKRVQQELGRNPLSHTPEQALDPTDPTNQAIAGMYERNIEPPSVFRQSELIGRAKALGIKNPENIPTARLQEVVENWHRAVKPDENNVLRNPLMPLIAVGMGVAGQAMSLGEKIENLKPRWLKDLTKSEAQAAKLREVYSRLDENIRSKLSPSEEKAYGFTRGVAEIGTAMLPITRGYQLFGALTKAPALGQAVIGKGPAARSALAWMASVAAYETGGEVPWTLPDDFSMADVQLAFQGDLMKDPAARHAAATLFFGNRPAVIAQAGLMPFVEAGLRAAFGGVHKPYANVSKETALTPQGPDGPGGSARYSGPTDPYADIPYADFEILGDDALGRWQDRGGGGGGVPATSPDMAGGGTPLADRFLRRLGPGEEIAADISGHSTPSAPPIASADVALEQIFPRRADPTKIPDVEINPPTIESPTGTAANDFISPVPLLQGPVSALRDQFGRPLRQKTTLEDAKRQFVELQDRQVTAITAQDFAAKQLETTNQTIAMMPPDHPELPKMFEDVKRYRAQIQEQADVARSALRDLAQLRQDAGVAPNAKLPGFWDLLKENPISPLTPTAQMLIQAGTTVQANGQPIETYHGTGVTAKVVTEGIQDDKLGWNDPTKNLFSPGFYSHTNPTAAGGDPFRPVAHRGYAFERSDDVEQMRVQAEARIKEYRRVATDILQHGGSQEQLQQALGMMEHFKTQLDELPTPTPGVLRVFLNHRKTFHADELIPVEEALEILKVGSETPELANFNFAELAEEMKERAWEKSQYMLNGVPQYGGGMVNGTYFFEELSKLEDQRLYADDDAIAFNVNDRVLNKARVGLLLEAAGYDGIRYQGGIRMSSDVLPAHAYVTFRAKNVVPVFMDDPIELEAIAQNLGIRTQKIEAVMDAPNIDHLTAGTTIGDAEVLQAQVAAEPGAINLLRGISDVPALMENVAQAKDEGFLKYYRLVQAPNGRLDLLASTLDEITDDMATEYAQTGFFRGMDVVKVKNGMEAKILKIDPETQRAFVQTPSQANRSQLRGNWTNLSNLVPHTYGRGVIEAPEFYERFKKFALATNEERAAEAGATNYKADWFDPHVSQAIQHDLQEYFSKEKISDRAAQAAIERYVDMRRIEEARQLDPESAKIVDRLEQELNEAETLNSTLDEPSSYHVAQKALTRGYTLATNIGEPGYLLQKQGESEVIPFVTEEAASAYLDMLDTVPPDITPATPIPFEIAKFPADNGHMADSNADDMFVAIEQDQDIIEDGFRAAAEEAGITLPKQPETPDMPPDFLSKSGYMPQSITVEWATPQKVFDRLNDEFNFTLDAAASKENAKVSRFFTKEDDALSQSWAGQTVWLNPPYGKGIEQWMAKAYSESLRGATVVALVPNRTDTKWFEEFASKGEVRFVRGRLKFGETAKKQAPFGSMVVVFRPPTPEFSISVDEGKFSVVSYMRTGEGKIGMNFDPSTVQKMGANMYENQLGAVTTKELLQNATDAVEHLGADGRVKVQINEKENTIRVIDNGHGMTPETVAKHYVDVGASLKENNTPRGGYGFAKVAYFSQAAAIDMTTIRKLGDDLYISTTIQGDKDRWVQGDIDIRTKTYTQAEMDELGLKTGTDVELKLEPRTKDDGTEEDLGWYYGAAHMTNTIHFSTLPTVFEFEHIDSSRWSNGPITYRTAITAADDLDPNDVFKASVPGANITIQPSKTTKKAYSGGSKTFSEMYILNSGLFQYRFMQSFEAEEAPSYFVVDVSATKTPSEADYPFTPSRESVKKPVAEVIKEYFDNINHRARVRDYNHLIVALSEAPFIGELGSTGKVYPMDGKAATKVLASDVAASAYANELLPLATDIYTDIARAALELGRYEVFADKPGRFAGIGLSKGFIAANLQTAGLAKTAAELGVANPEEEQNLIMLNPFTLMMELENKFTGEWHNALQGDTFEAASVLARQTWGALVHEAIHQLERGHGKDFVAHQTRLPNFLFDIIGPSYNALRNWWDRTLKDQRIFSHYERFYNDATDDFIFKQYDGHKDEAEVQGGDGRPLPVSSSEAWDAFGENQANFESDTGGEYGPASYLRVGSGSQGTGSQTPAVRYPTGGGGGSGIVPPGVGNAGDSGRFLPRPPYNVGGERRKALDLITDGLRGFPRNFLLPMRNSFQWMEDQMHNAGFPEWRPAMHFDNIVAATDFARNQGFDLHIDTNQEIAHLGSRHLRTGQAWRVFEQHRPEHRKYYADKWGFSERELESVVNVREMLENQIGKQEVRDWIDYIGMVRNEHQSNNFAPSVYAAPQGSTIGYFAEYARKRGMKFGGSPDLRWAVPEFIRSHYYGKHAAPIVKQANEFFNKVKDVEVLGDYPYRPLANFFLDWSEYIETGYKPGLDIAARTVSKLFSLFTPTSEHQAREFINFMMRQSYRALLGHRAHTVIRDSLQVLLASPVVGGEYLDRAITALVKQGPEYEAMIERAYAHATVQKGVIKTGMQEWGEHSRMSERGDSGGFHQQAGDNLTLGIIDTARDIVPPHLRSISGTKLDPLWLYGKENLGVRLIIGEAAYQRFSDVWSDWMITSREAIRAGTPENVPSLDEVIQLLNMGGYSPSMQRRVKELLASGDPEGAAGVYMREVANDTAMIFGNINTPPGLRGSTARLAMTLGHFSQGMLAFLDRLIRYGKQDPRLLVKTLGLLTGWTLATEIMQEKTGIKFRNWNPLAALAFVGSPAFEAAVAAWQTMKGVQQTISSGPESTRPDSPFGGFGKPVMKAFHMLNPAEGIMQNIGAIGSSMDSPNPAGSAAQWLMTGGRNIGANQNRMYMDQLVDSLLQSRGIHPREAPQPHRMPGVNQFQYQKMPVPVEPPPLESAMPSWYPQDTSSGGKGAM